MNVKEDGMNDECNCVYFYYCDGASFSGYRKDPWLVPNTTEKLYFRGIKNLDVSIDTLMKDFKFGDATEVVITGGSAGGLSTFLHTDRVKIFMFDTICFTFWVHFQNRSHSNWKMKPTSTVQH